MFHALDNRFIRSRGSVGISNSHLARRSRNPSWQMNVSNMFFQMSSLRVVRVTHKMVYPCLSKLSVAVAMAVQVFPTPVPCHNSIPFKGFCGVKYRWMNSCVGEKATTRLACCSQSRAPPWEPPSFNRKIPPAAIFFSKSSPPPSNLRKLPPTVETDL